MARKVRSRRGERPEQCRARLERRGLYGELTAACLSRAVAVDDVLGGVRSRSVSRARRAFWLSLHEWGLSQNEIAALFGVDHSSVLHGLRVARDELRSEEAAR